MIRSLVGAPEDASPEIRRNLPHDELARALDAGHTVWIDIVDAEPADLEWVEENLDLHPAVISDLHRDDRRPTLMVYPAYLFLSLFQPVREQDRVIGSEVHCISGEGYLITVRKGISTAVEKAYDVAARNTQYWNRSEHYFLFLVMQYVIDAYYPLLDRINVRLTDIEERVLTAEDDPRVMQTSVYRIKQQLVNLRQMVSPQREVLSSLIGEGSLAVSEQTREPFHHLYERLLRIYDVIDGQRDLWSNVLELIRSREAQNLSRVVSRLTILSMIFLPLTFILGVFELNFITTNPVLAIPVPGHLMLLVLMVGMGLIVGLMFFLYKRFGWV
ncbi:MAG: magnesium transporter CorA family protein [Chloroflexi bacterium]|nr:magnesium transporter CorA family protein [Chloroflexota bacterium]